MRHLPQKNAKIVMFDRRKEQWEQALRKVPCCRNGPSVENANHSLRRKNEAQYIEHRAMADG
jgi:hypothetical protein